MKKEFNIQAWTIAMDIIYEHQDHAITEELIIKLNKELKHRLILEEKDHKTIKLVYKHPELGHKPKIHIQINPDIDSSYKSPIHMED